MSADRGTPYPATRNTVRSWAKAVRVAGWYGLEFSDRLLLAVAILFSMMVAALAAQCTSLSHAQCPELRNQRLGEQAAAILSTMLA